MLDKRREVGAHPGDARVSVVGADLEIGVLVELLEALLAADLIAGRPEQPLERLPVRVLVGHHGSSRSSAVLGPGASDR